MKRDVQLSHFKTAYEPLSEAILLIDDGLTVCFANKAFTHQFEITADAIVGNSANSIFLDEQGHSSWPTLPAVSGNHFQNMFVSTGENGDSVPVNITIDQFQSDESNDFYVVRLERSSIETQTNQVLKQLAYRDELTGLANRALFQQLLEHEISQAKRQQTKFAVLFIDLDRFKDVNDIYGHDVGDFLLYEIAQRLQKNLRKSDVIARLGGDEFVVLMHNIKDSETVANVAEKLIRELHKPVVSGAHRISVGCSVGISLFPENSLEASHLLQHADVAMYRAKQQGGDNFYYFSEEMNREIKDARELEQQIRDSLSGQHFLPFFQPLIDQRTGLLVGIECLSRWQHPERGLLNPMEFIPVAKKAGLMPEILHQVLDGAFAQLRQWHEKMGCFVPLSVNITSKQFYQIETFEELSALLKNHDLTSDAIRIEVTESTLQERGDGLIELLKRVSNAGFSITLDDFGTGYSSLRYLQQLPVDTLKIDRSFVRNLENNPHDKIIVKAIIQLAQTLGIEAVAEGVETEAQKEFLRGNQCHIMQGFLFSQALSAEDFDNYIDQLTLDSAV